MSNSEFVRYTQSLAAKYIKNNRVLLLQSPQFLLNSFNRTVAKAKGYYVYPPTGLQCIQKALADRELEIKIVDLNYEVLSRVVSDDDFDIDNWLELLDDVVNDFKPSFIGVTCISVYTDVFDGYHPMTLILEFLKKKDIACVVAGGPIASNEYDNYLLKDLCHFVVVGEGEEKIQFLMDTFLQRKQVVADTPKIFYKNNEEVAETSGSSRFVVLSGNLKNTYVAIPVERYCEVGSLNPFMRMTGQQNPFSVIQLNRGCSANCSFCGVTEFMGKGVRRHPINEVLVDIDYLVKERGVRHFEILDDDFLSSRSDQNELNQLLDFMADLCKTYNISWAAGNGLIAAYLSEPLMRKISASGCVGFRIGVESGNSEMLRRMHKPATLSVLRSCSEMLQSFPDIFIGGNYIIGLFAEETFEQMLDTFYFAKELNLDWAGYTTFQFTNNKTIIEEQTTHSKKEAADFIPTKNRADRSILSIENILSGPDVFKLPLSMIPSIEQIKEIWFLFNLISNFIDNKNLKPGGNPAKLANWLKAIEVTYPDNPYITLFIALSYVLLDEKELARSFYCSAKNKLARSEYWQKRFRSFCLNEIIDYFPQESLAVYEVLNTLIAKYNIFESRG